MRNAWASTLQEFWHSPAFPMWVTLAAAGFFAIMLLFTLIRAEKSVANGALTVITLLAIGIAVAATVRRFGPLNRTAEVVAEVRPAPPMVAPVAALSCLDGLAGDSVEAPCERSLFATADVSAAAVSYTAAQLSRLVPNSDPAAQTPEQQLLRQTLARDRYGLVAQVLVMRDHCTETDCRAFALFPDPSRIKSNMHDHVYDATINHYAASWSAAPTPLPTPAIAGLTPQVAKPSSIDFPSAASIPPVNIMTTEPGAATPPPPKPAAATANAQATPPRPAAKKPPPKSASATAAKPKGAPTKPEPQSGRD